MIIAVCVDDRMGEGNITKVGAMAKISLGTAI